MGRLTQALAHRFSSCVGLDISEHWIQQAEEINRFANCKYVAHSDAHLPFVDEGFSFIYSNIAL